MSSEKYYSSKSWKYQPPANQREAVTRSTNHASEGDGGSNEGSGTATNLRDGGRRHGRPRLYCGLRVGDQPGNYLLSNIQVNRQSRTIIRAKGNLFFLFCMTENSIHKALLNLYLKSFKLPEEKTLYIFTFKNK